MSNRLVTLFMFAGFLWFGLASARAEAWQCHASSGPTRTALVELFTSEGCSSCPPADRWLSALRTRQDAQLQLAPLAFHVDYWNQLGWPDRFAQPEFTTRQRWIGRLLRSPTIYTPQFVLDGRDWRPSRNGLADPRRNPPPGADLRLESAAPADGQLAVAGEARLRARGKDAQLFLAVHENNLSSRIKAGENAGKLLKHDFVVRQLLGPFAIPATGLLAFKQVFSLGADWKLADLGVTAFVQNATSGEVDQALQLPLCRQ